MQSSSQVLCSLATETVAMWSEGSLKVLNTGLRDRYSTYSQWPHSIGLDVHQATISVAVLDHSGKAVMECIVETKANTILEFFAGLRGTLSVTFEEGTPAAWLYDLLRTHVARAGGMQSAEKCSAQTGQ